MKNNTDTTIKYWKETAVWQESWVFNSDKIDFVYRMHESNGPMIQELKSKEILNISDSIEVNKSFFSDKPAYIKIGFVFVNSTEATNFYDAMFLIRNKRDYLQNIFWSDSIKLRR